MGNFDDTKKSFQELLNECQEMLTELEFKVACFIGHLRHTLTKLKVLDNEI